VVPEEELKRYVLLHLHEHGLPGMTVGLADANGFTATLTAGWADVDKRTPVRGNHLFQIGSITKSFAGLCCFRLAEAGRLDLDAEVNAVLPGAGLPAAAKITVRHLLNHCSGLPSDAPVLPRGGGDKLWVGYAPGSRMTYSNTAYTLLGLILQRIERCSMAEVISRNVLEPLGMHGAAPVIRRIDRSRYAVGYQAYLADRPQPRAGPLATAAWLDSDDAAGCIAATAAQMTNYLRWLIDAGSGRGGPLLSDAGAVRFCTPAIAAPEFGPQAHYANGLATIPVDGRPCLHHTGGMLAFASAMTIDPAAGVGAFAAVNAVTRGVGGGEYRPRQITAYALGLMRAVREGRPLPMAPEIVDAQRVEAAASYAGRLRSGEGETIELRAEGERLKLLFAGGAAALEPVGEGRFLVRDPRFSLYQLCVEPGPHGAAAAWWGPRLYGAEAASLAARAPAPTLLPLAGCYNSDNLWKDPVRVVVRGERLWVDGVGYLTALADGGWRAGEDAWSPERIIFDGVIDGQVQRLNFSGADYFRSSDCGPA